MTEVNKALVQRVKQAVKKAGKELTDGQITKGIMEYFDPAIPPIEASEDQLNEIVELLLGED